MVRIRLYVVVGLALLAFSILPRAALAVGEGWPVYGHDPAHTSRSTANGPNSADIKWIYSADGLVRDVVVAADGSIYARVLISLTEQEVIALYPDGTLKWSITTTTGQYAFPSVGSDGKIYVILNNQTDPDYLLALNPADGTTAWDFDLGRSSIGTGLTFVNNSRPTVDSDGTIYIASTLGRQGYGTIYAINPDGTQKWSWDTQQDSLYCHGQTYLVYCAIESSPALAPNGYLYFKPFGEGVIALDSATGAFLWRNNFGGGTGGADPYAQSLSVGSDSVAYTSEGTGRFNLYALTPDNAVKWTFVTDNWNDPALSPISADGSTVYHSDNGGVLYAIDTAEGDLRWRFDTPVEGVGIPGAPVLAANGIIYFTILSSNVTPPGSPGYVYALRADSGEIVWQYDIGFSEADLAMGPDGTLFVPDDNDQLYAFQCADSTCAIPPHDPLHIVTNLNDSGAGSLRQAAADSIYGDTIEFQSGLSGTLALASPVTISTRVTINGPAADTITLDGGDAHALFSIAAGKRLDINHLTIANGKPGIITNGKLNISHMLFTGSDNPSGSGGALLVNDGALVSIDHSTFSNNTAYNGGVIYNNGVVTISSSTFFNNQANSEGGVIFSLGGAASSGVRVLISNSTFTGNTAFLGGALDNSGYNTVLTVVNSTIAENHASYGGGVYHVSFFGATTTLQNTILANNSGGNCDGLPTNGGGNVQYPGSSCGSLPVGNPLLDALADNGGSTWTMALQTGSAAIDAGNTALCAAPPVSNLDQRGVIRPVDGDGKGGAQCDAGAFEAPVPPTGAPSLNYYTTDKPVLTWHPVSWAIRYEIQVDTDNAFAEPYAFHNDDISPHQDFIQTTHLNSGTYFWRIRAKQPDGKWGAWSSVESFMVDTG